MARTFLQAEWRKLAMANYEVDPLVLTPYLPLHTELDLYNSSCLVSLVGFMFLNTKIKGISIPFHTDFEEVNLRFYVRYKDQDQWKRGVVFIKEIVPRRALTFVANTIYGENYETMPMNHHWKLEQDQLKVSYQWSKQNQWQSIIVRTNHTLKVIVEGSEEEFITEHYWAYTRLGKTKTSEYGVEHLRWQVYQMIDYTIDVDFGFVYGQPFDFLTKTSPRSVILAEGSAITVKSGRIVKPSLQAAITNSIQPK